MVAHWVIDILEFIQSTGTKDWILEKAHISSAFVVHFFAEPACCSQTKQVQWLRFAIEGREKP